jgi:ATP citrate (pro-S)-lyase
MKPAISITELRGNFQPRIACLGSHPGIIQSMLDYDYLNGQAAPGVVVIVSQGRKQERYFWGEQEIELPVVASIDGIPADKKASINAILALQSGRRVLSSVQAAIAGLPALRVGSIFAEQVPEAHSLQLGQLTAEHGILLTGPASVGLLVPGSMKLGAIGGTQHQQIIAARILRGGDTAVISTSGGMVNELIHSVTGNGRGISFGLALGGDRYPVTSPSAAFLLAEADEQTKHIVYFGELGGDDEYAIAKLITEGKITKPVMAYIAGTVAELFATPPQFGHAKAMAESHNESASAKKQVLREAGVTVLDSFADLAPTLKSLPADTTATEEKAARTIGSRQKWLIVSHLSGESNGDSQLLGQNLLDTVNQNSLAGLTLSLLLGQKVESERLITFTDFVLRLLTDHGPYVSGAINTITAARAGRDLVSSLSAGLLTIGPRFGGAINQAAGHWLRGVREGLSPKEFVNTFTDNGGIIPGIGHKKYRLDLPDPRVKALQELLADTNGPHLQFALGVQDITTSKKNNLILNVDGTIAAMLLDLLSTELNYNHDQLQELVDIEFFNALFVLSRSIGFTGHYLDQRRHDEGLLRLSDKDVGYLPPPSS